MLDGKRWRQTRTRCKRVDNLLSPALRSSSDGLRMSVEGCH